MLYKNLFLFSPDEPIINTLPTSSGRIVTSSDLEDYALSSEIPTKVSELDNDLNFVEQADLPTTLPNTYSITFKANANESICSYDGSSSTTLTFNASPTSGAFTISDGTTTRTIQLVGTFTDTNYYPTTFTWTDGTTFGPTGSLSGSGMATVSFEAIPVATSTRSGVVNTIAQTFGGQKTFEDISVTNHVTIFGNEDDLSENKPTNETGLTGDVDSTMWNTGVSVYDAANETGYQYSFPDHSGTFAMIEDVHAAMDCLPLAGGTMNTDATITLTHSSGNTNVLAYDGVAISKRSGNTQNWSAKSATYDSTKITLTSKGQTTGPNHNVHTWDNTYILNLPLEGQIVESGDTGATLLTDESLKTINGQSLVGSGDIVIGEDETERTFSTHGSAQFFKTFDLHIANSDYAYNSSHASDIDILDAFSENIEHFGLAICRFGNTRTLNPMKNGGQQRKGWFIEPNICKRGRCNITGFSQNDDAYVTSYSLQDLIEFVFDGMNYKSGDSQINLMPTLSLLLKSKTYRSKTYESLKKGYADAHELVFEIENTSTIDVPIKPSIARATSNYLTFDSNKLNSTTQIGTGGFLYDKVVTSVKFNLLIGEWGSIYIDTSSNSSFHGYHPRCMWTDAMKTFIALKTPSASGKNWRLIIQFASAK